MKKYFLSLVAMAAAMLFATSCQESLVEPQVGGPTTFTVQVPDAMGTKAIGDIGDKRNVNQLLVAVYSEATGDAPALTRATATSTSGEFKVQFNLLQDQSYHIVFWAQVENKYVVANNDFELKSIPMTNIYHNNEDGAAFFAYVADFVPTGSAQSVTLKRPFAQLNLGTTEQSLQPATGDVSLVSSEIKIKGLAQSFNTILGMGEVPTTEVVTYYATIPENWQKLSAAGSTYEYVSMDYLPIVGDDKAVFDIEANIVVKDAANAQKTINHKFTSVPVQENYRTNIVGNLISSTSDFIVSIDDRFVDENGNLNPDNDYLVVDNVYEAQVAFGNGETHVAINNIGNTQTLQLPNNGKELYLQLPDSDGQITIKRDAGNFNISVPDTNPSNTGLTIIIVAPNSTVDFTGQAYVIYSTTASNTLNLNGAKVGKIIVEKGNVVIENESKVDGLDNQSDEEVTVYVDNSSVVTVPENEGFNKIEEPEINSLENLQTVLNYSASDVIVVPNGIVNTTEFTLRLNGKTVTAVDNATVSYGLITNKAELTIVGPGTISLTATNNRAWNAYSSVISNTVGGNLTVGEGVVIEHLGGTDMAYGIDNLTNGKGTSAIATINDATVKSTYRAVRQFLNGTEADNILTVNSGAVIEGPNKSIWMQDPNKSANSGKLFVNSGAVLNGDVYLSVTAESTEWPVEVSIAATSLKNESEVLVNNNVPAGYEVVEVGGVWKVIKSELWELVSTADELAKALTANKSVIFANDIEQADGVVITDKNITIDLNGKTYTVTEGASTNNRNFKINGSSEVTIKNGTMVAQGELTSGAYGTIRTEEAANVTLENVKLYSYRGFGLNVKANSGTTIKIKDSEIYSEYSGGVEAAGGTIELTNVKIDQKGVYSSGAWCSVAIGVNGGGKVIVNSGEYNAATISTDANAEQGTWVAYLMNSGGTMEINGGTFNGTVGKIATAANACGLICVDANSKLKINSGEFNSTGAILDMRNNNGQTNPEAVLYGGNFSADPRVSGLYASNLIQVAEGYVVNLNANGTYTVIPTTLKDGAVLDLGGVEYNGTITVEGNVTIKGDTKIKTLKSTTGCTITIEDGKTLTLNSFSFGNSDNATAKYVIKGGTIVANYGFFQYGEYKLYSNFETGYMYYSYGSNITLYGTFHSKGTGDGLDYVRGNLTIAEGGRSIHDKSLWIGQPASWGAMNATLTIEEGGYVQANSLSVYEGSTLTYSNDEDLKYNSITVTGEIIKE